MMIPFTSLAQSNDVKVLKTDSTSNVEVKISVNKLTELENLKLDAEKKLKLANKQIFELEKKAMNDSAIMKKNTETINGLKADNSKLKNEIVNYKEQLVKTDKCLVSIASNFLYLPYEEYSVKEVALRAFETISDNTFKEKYSSRKVLLENYKEDINKFISFLTTTQKGLSNPFTKEANAEISNLHKQSFYIAYQKYEDWKATYLGAKIVNVESQLKSFSQTHKVNFEKIINELSNCLKTE